MTRRRDNAIRRRHPGVRGVWSKRGNWYRPVHLYSRHFWLISRVFSTFLKAYCVEFSPSLLSFFPSLPLSGEDHFSTPLWPAIPRRISISLFSTLSLRHISLSLSLLYLFCPLVFSPSSHTFILCRLYGLRLYIPVCTLRRKRKEKKRDGKSCHSSTANPSFLSFSRKSSLPWIFSRESQFPGERDWIKLEPKGWKDCLLESVVKFVGLGRSRDVTCYSLAGGNLSW